MTLYDSLIEYTASDAYPFHMPGHKRRAEGMCDPLRIDITEIDGFDNLHHAEGILLEAQEKAAKLYGSSETHFLVNGSTAGILSAIGACTRPGSTLLMARNSHRSAYNAAALNRVRTAWLYPQINECCGPVDPSEAEAELSRRKDVSAVFITSPTYDGVVSDVKQLARIAHRHGVVLIVDEAHGAHFGMHEIFPESSVKLGADIVIHSLHKTLPALTQTALIHVNGSLVDRQRLRRLLSVYQTSSPSYILMASIDRCVNLLLEKGNELFDAYARRLGRFYDKTSLHHLSLLRTDDPSRILIRPAGIHRPAGSVSRPLGINSAGSISRPLGINSAGGISRPLDINLAGSVRPSDDTHDVRCKMTAMELYHTLRTRFHLQPEMVTTSYVLMLSSVCDDEEGFSRLSDALLQLDAEAGASCNETTDDSANCHAAVSAQLASDDSTQCAAGNSANCHAAVSAQLASDNSTQCAAGNSANWPAASAAQLAAGNSVSCAQAYRLRPEEGCTIAQALDSAHEEIPFTSSAGHISAEFLTIYPPGIPLLAPGEIISEEMIENVLELKRKGYSVQGPDDHSLRMIRTVRESKIRQAHSYRQSVN